MNKEDCTRVPVRVEPFLGKGGGLCVCVTTAQEKNIVATIHKDRSGHWSDGMDAANAELIAEAFNVLHETGSTPRDLETALVDLVATASEVEGMMDGDKDKQEAWAEELSRLYIALDAAKAALAKYQPTNA